MTEKLYFIIWLTGILPSSLLFKLQALRKWSAFWCGFWWPMTLPFFFVIVWPVYFIQKFVEKYL